MDSPPPPQSAGIGDPHFLGFDSKWYNFEGVSGGIFNILSGPNYQFNAHLTNFEDLNVENCYMRGFGLKIGTNHKLRVEVVGQGTLMAEYNGQELTSILEPGVPVDVGDNITIGMYWPGIRDGQTILVDNLDFRFWMYIGAGEGHADFQIHQKTVPKFQYHGIVGQTLRPEDAHASVVMLPNGEFQVYGELQDYKVTGLFEDDFKYNMFNPTEQIYSSHYRVAPGEKLEIEETRRRLLASGSDGDMGSLVQAVFGDDPMVAGAPSRRQLLFDRPVTGAPSHNVVFLASAGRHHFGEFQRLTDRMYDKLKAR